MRKDAATLHPVNELITRRWSPRQFADKEISPEIIASLFEAARWAPSAYNDQPWAYVLGTREDAKAYEKVLSCLVEFNQGWAKRAPLIAIGIYRDHFSFNESPYPHAPHDLGLANAFLTLEATARGLMVHHMSGMDFDKAREVLEIPEGWHPFTAFAVGYPVDPEQLSEEELEAEQAPRSRHPQEEFVFHGAFGKA